MALSGPVARLVVAVQELSLAENREQVQTIVLRAARELVNADGVTFVLRDGEECFYVDEDAIAPLWKGLRFPLEACVSGWAMTHRQAVVIPDVFVDERVPHDAYRRTFVKSVCMMPIRTLDPVGAVGVYWAHEHTAGAEELAVLRALADSTSMALESVSVLGRLDQARRTAVTDELTGLANRRGFLMLAEKELQQVSRHRRPACVFFLDVDGLKDVNDTLGHDAGDRLLQRMRDALLSTFRAEDVVARIGGDEFAVFTAGEQVPGAMLRRLRAVMSEQPATDGVVLQASVGTALYRRGSTIEGLLAEADAAMYLEKASRRARRGKAQVVTAG